jgi:hypothetical protein
MQQFSSCSPSSPFVLTEKALSALHTVTAAMPGCQCHWTSGPENHQAVKLLVQRMIPTQLPAQGADPCDWSSNEVLLSGLVDAVEGRVAVQASQLQLHWVTAQHTHEGSTLLQTSAWKAHIGGSIADQHL